jgi:5'-nucleotidase
MPVRRLAAALSWAVLALVVGSAPYALRADAQSGPSGTVTLSIVGTNDVHGGVLPVAGRGGLALLAGYVRNLRDARARDGGAVLLIDAGDMWQGTLESNLSEGASVVAAYNALGYAAAAIGNHEFDFGPAGPAATPLAATDDPRGALKARAAEARFPLLTANLIDTATGAPVAWPNVKPSVTVEAAGIPIGIVGVMTSTALTQTISSNTAGLRVAPLAESIVGEARRLREAGAAAVIVAAHAGGECTRFEDPTDLSSCDPASEIFAVARALPAGLVDYIIAGHVHEGLGHEVAGIAITSAYSGGYAFGRVDLQIDRASRKVVSRRIYPPHQLCEREDPKTARCDPDQDARGRVVSRYEGERVRSDARIAAVLTPAVRQASRLKATRLGVLVDGPIRRGHPFQSALGNLFVDALRESMPGAEVALNNVRGGLRADLPSGPLTYGSVFSMIPFDNRVATMQLTGAQLRLVLTEQLKADAPRVGISGVRVRAECAGSNLRVTLQRASGAPIGDDDRLVVVTTDFVAFGGNEILTSVMPPGGFPVADDAPVARELIAAWLKKRGGRLRQEQFMDVRNPRWRYPGELPVVCP